MKIKISLVLWFATLFQVAAQIPAGYYDSAQGLTGYQLKTALKDIIDNHTAYSYNELYTIYETTDSDYYYENDGSVLDMYSENPAGQDPYNYQHHQNTCGQYSGEGDCYNREHIIPQSIFNSASPMKSDAHFVVPTDGYVNNRRSSYPFGDVSGATWTSQNGSKLGNCANAGYSGTVFEPIDEFKGDIARMIFYVATRYEDQIASWNNTAMFDGTSDHVFSDWFLQVLVSWHQQDPVSQREIDRNDAVYAYQNNRNPFIDHPEWVNQIWNPGVDTQAPSIPGNLHAQNITDTSADLVWDPSSDNMGVAQYLIFLDGTQVGTSVTTNYHLDNLQPGTTYEACVKAQDAAGNTSACSGSVTFETSNPYTLIFEENFDNCGNLQFVSISEASNKDWECVNQYGENNTSAMQINGYQADTACLDWLITANPVDFDANSGEQLSLYTAYTYGDTPLQLLYSTDYDGGNFPSNFTWNPVPNVSFPVPNGSSSEQVYTVTGADISAISGQVYMAFKYDTANYSPTRWTVDSFKIISQEPGAVAVNGFNSVKLYPNPVHNGLIHLQYDAMELKEVKILDVTGKLLIVNKKDKHIVNFNTLPQGIYYVQLIFDSGTMTRKIAVE